MCMEIKQRKNYDCDNVMYLGGHISHYKYLLNIGKRQCKWDFCHQGNSALISKLFPMEMMVT